MHLGHLWTTDRRCAGVGCNRVRKVCSEPSPLRCSSASRSRLRPDTALVQCRTTLPRVAAGKVPWSRGGLDHICCLQCRRLQKDLPRKQWLCITSEPPTCQPGGGLKRRFNDILLRDDVSISGGYRKSSISFSLGHSDN